MEVPDYLHARVNELITMEQNVALARGYWAVVLGLTPKLDGDQWCLLWGDNLITGVVAFGSSPIEAILNFDTAMHEKPEGK